MNRPFQTDNEPAINRQRNARLGRNVGHEPIISRPLTWHINVQ